MMIMVVVVGVGGICWGVIMGGALGLASGQLVTPDYAAADNGEETLRSLQGSAALH